MADTLITPTAGSLSWLGAAARVITIGLVLTGFPPGVSTGSDPHVCLPGVGTLTLSGASPELTGLGLRLRGYPPLVATNKVSVATGVGSLSLTGAAPTLINTNLSVALTPTAGSLTLTGQSPTIPVASAVVNPTTGVLSLVRESFPTTGILDTFDRADEDPVNTNWDVLKLGRAECRVVSNTVRPPAAARGWSYWASNNFGPDSEIYATVVTRPNTGEYCALHLRIVSPNSAARSGYMAMFFRSATANRLSIVLTKITGNNESDLFVIDNAAIWADGDQIGFSAIGSQLHVWHRPGASVWRILAAITDTTHSSSGNIGIELSDITAVNLALDTLGGGTNVPPPTAPNVNLRLGMRLTGYAPILLTVGTFRSDTLAGSLTLTGLAPTVTTTQPISIVPSAGALTLTPFLSGVFGGSWIISPSVATLTLTSTQQIIPGTATALKCQPWNQITWVANTESDLAGYKVYHGTTSGVYTESVTLGIVLTYVWNNLPYGNNYFVVTAFDSVGNESAASAEVSSFTSGSGFAPTLTNSSPASRTPQAGSMSFVGLAPLIQSYQVPTTGALVLTGFAPNVLIPQSLTPGVGALTLTGLAPVAGGISTIAPTVGGLTLTGFTPNITNPFILTPTAGALTLTGIASSLQRYTVPASDALTLTGLAPFVINPMAISTGTGALTLASAAPNIQAYAVPAQATLTFTTFAPLIHNDGAFEIIPDAGALTLASEVPAVLGFWPVWLANQANQVLDAGGSPDA